MNKRTFLSFVTVCFVQGTFFGVNTAGAQDVSQSSNCASGKNDYFIDTTLKTASNESRVRFEVVRSPQEFIFKTGFDYKSLPQLQVLSEFGSFECEVRAIQALWSTYNYGEDLSKVGCYKALVWWMPGSDYSGCSLKLVIPGQSHDWMIDLYMNYFLE